MRNSRARMALQQGATLVELLAACCIGAVSLAAAAPSLQQLLARNQSQADVAELTEALRLARSEALKRSTEITVCAAAPEQPGREPACRTDGNDWSAGWLVFMDGGEQGRLEPGDLLLRAYQRRNTAGEVKAGLHHITFQSTGLSSRANGKFQFMPPGAAGQQAGAQPLQLVCVNKPGRAKVMPGPECSS